MMLQRKAYSKLVEWKRTAQGRSALLIEGARRVGKSTLVQEFAEREYRTHLIIDFSVAPNDVKELFETKRDDISAFFLYLSAYYNIPFHERETLIVFDEVQFCPHARSLIKHLVADGRYDYIETGSLMSIKQNISDILIPSEEESFELHPFDFEEFCMAKSETVLIDLMREASETLAPLPEPIHRKCASLFREYMLVGGMPQAVVAFLESNDFHEADTVKRRILNLYRNDVSKFAKGYESKVLSIFDSIPTQLSQREKRFNLAALSKSARMRSYENAFFWLTDAMITNMCYNASDPSVGLAMKLDKPSFKCFMEDTGLLASLAFADNQETSHDIYRDILFDRLQINEGMLTENIVSQQFIASGRKLYYYSRNSREDASESMEIDFLIVGKGAKAKVCPIEVKSGTGLSSVSLKKFQAKFGSKIGQPYVLYPGNIKRKGEALYLPLYLSLWI